MATTLHITHGKENSKIDWMSSFKFKQKVKKNEQISYFNKKKKEIEYKHTTCFVEIQKEKLFLWYKQRNKIIKNLYNK